MRISSFAPKAKLKWLVKSNETFKNTKLHIDIESFAIVVAAVTVFSCLCTNYVENCANKVYSYYYYFE